MTMNVATYVGFVDCVVTGDLTHDDLPNLFDALERARTRGPFVLITDTLDMREAPNAVLMAFANRLKKMPPMKGVWLGDAVVIRSAVTRFAVSTLLMVAPLPTEVKVFEEREAAQRWCAELLTRAGVPVPYALQRSKLDYR
jgi:hypothetical protein